MKKRLILIITISVILISTIVFVAFSIYNRVVDKGGIYVGMTYKEFNENLDGRNIENYSSYNWVYFFEDENGKNTVVEFDGETQKVVRINKYKKRIAKSKEFENLEQGTSIFKIVKTAGLPTINPYLSYSCMEYTSKEGDVYSLVLNPHESTLYSCSLVNSENN